MSTRDQLEREGWKVASVSSGDHLRRILSMYEELGLETRLEEVSLQECSGCRECYLAGDEPQYRVYVKRNRDADTGSQTT